MGGQLEGGTRVQGASDGYTIMMAHIAAISILPSLVAKLPHDTQTEFAPISLAAIGADTVGNSPEEFTAFIRIETEKYARIVKAANIKFD